MTAERRADQATSDRLALIHADVLAERRRVTFLLALTAALLFALGGVSFYFHGQQGALAHEAADQAQRAAVLANAIQSSRKDTFLRACLQDTQRNRATIDRYDAEIRQRVKAATPAERARLHESRAFFVQLINAFLPARTDKECAAFVQRQIHIPPAAG